MMKQLDPLVRQTLLTFAAVHQALRTEWKVFHARLYELADAAGLSRGEYTVAKELLTGRSYRSIAQQMKITPDTAKKRIASVYRKVGVKNRGGLVGVYFSLWSLETPDGEQEEL